MFYTYFSEIVYVHAPLKEHRVKNIKQPEWLEILPSIEVRDYYKKDGDEVIALLLHKSGSTDGSYNYRPISILSFLSKIIERHVHDHILKHLSEHYLLYEYQSGFCAQHSFEAALLQMTDTWLKAIDDNRLVGTIFLDLQKAFDVVDHSILVKKTGSI